MSLWIAFLLIAITLAYALTGGVFLAFSDFIMRALARTTGGAGTMQVINREVFRWVFMTLFLGLAPISIAVSYAGLFILEGSGGALIAAAGLTYFFGCFIVTVFFNVPMNNALAKLNEGTNDAQEYWESTYVPRWTFWNSIRTVACVGAAALLFTGLFLSALGGVPVA